MGPKERCVSFLSGFGQSPIAKRFLVHFEAIHFFHSHDNTFFAFCFTDFMLITCITIEPDARTQNCRAYSAVAKMSGSSACAWGVAPTGIFGLGGDRRHRPHARVGAYAKMFTIM